MITIRRYDNRDREAIIYLVLQCQNDGTRPIRTVEDQPELLYIEKSYFERNGYFWIAEDEGILVGCIGLWNAENGIGILKKFFLQEAYRGHREHIGLQLYSELLDFAKQHQFIRIILDTPHNTVRAHQFYEKAGFLQITQKELPVLYESPYADSDFFQLWL